MSTASISAEIDDPINAAILMVSEDLVGGFNAAQSELPLDTVLERIQLMLGRGVIRRVRQTLMATNLAQGSLVAWQVAPERLDNAFNFMFENDPFSGHVVIRSTDGVSAGCSYRLWTTLKVPQGFSLTKHAEYLRAQVGAERFLLMPAKRLFALGVGHVRRIGMETGAKSNDLADVIDTQIVTLTDLEWRVLVALKRELSVSEIVDDVWRLRSQEVELPLKQFIATAQELCRKGVIGRFSTFLEHVKPSENNKRVTRYNALFHWAVPEGSEIDAGRQVGRFAIMTHAYWREGGPEFKNVNVMGVAHGQDKDMVLSHKAAIDKHLEQVGIDVNYTNVFWGGRSEIKPSEIAPTAYREFCIANGIDPEEMR
jgi:hypothetical protein